MGSKNSSNLNLRECYRPWNLSEYRNPEYIRILRRFRIINKTLRLDKHASREVLETLAASDWSHLKKLIINLYHH